jgi:transcriptional regulator with XRE-family HTH domain
MEREDRVGARVAALRKARGLTGRQLALRANVSYSLLTKVESGHAVASPAFTGAVARALRIEVARLTGQPYEEPGGGVTQLREAIEPLRRALLTYDLPPASDMPSRHVDELRTDVHYVSDLGRHAQYAKIARSLPVLLDELSAAIQTANDDGRPDLYALLAESYGGISAIAHTLGLLDVRALALDRIGWASVNSQDPLRIARTQWSRGASLLAAASYGQGLVLMERTRRHVGESIGQMDDATRSVVGSLHLRSAILAARAGRRQDADAHLSEAREIAALVRPDANHYGMEFTPANVAIHRVSAAIEAEDGALALTRAREVERSGCLPQLPPVRAGHYRIEIARAWLYHGNPRRALRELKKARNIAPQQARHHPMVRETVQAIAQTTARPTAELSAFASWLGLLSDAVGLDGVQRRGGPECRWVRSIPNCARQGSNPSMVTFGRSVRSHSVRVSRSRCEMTTLPCRTSRDIRDDASGAAPPRVPVRREEGPSRAEETDSGLAGGHRVPPHRPARPAPLR